MKDFSAQLTREKFDLHPDPKDEEDGKAMTTAVGNRLEIKLSSKKNEEEAKFIVRAQNMQTCLRIGAHVGYHYFEYGDLPKSGRNRFEWRHIFKSVTEVYEEKWNPEIWAAIYQNGRVLYKEGAKYEAFLDIVELCMAYEKIDYSAVVHTLEAMFDKAKRPIHIDYDPDPVVKLNGNGREARLNIVRRGPKGKEIVKMQIKRKETRDVRMSPCLTAAAAVVEAYQLGFFVAKVNEMMHHAMLTLSNPEAVQGDHASRRITRMEEALEDFEQMYNVAYRPKAPNFEHFSKDIAVHFDKLYAESKQERTEMGSESEAPPVESD